MTPVDLELDCRGLLCPQPIIDLGRRYLEVEVGGLVAVVAEDPVRSADFLDNLGLRHRDGEFVELRLGFQYGICHTAARNRCQKDGHQQNGDQAG